MTLEDAKKAIDELVRSPSLGYAKTSAALSELLDYLEEKIEEVETEAAAEYADEEDP